MGHQDKVEGPDLAREGIALDDLQDDGRPRLGRFGDQAVAMARVGEDVVAFGAKCTHWNGPLHKGIVRGRQVLCPWHHSRFDLTTGEAAAPPALSGIPIFDVRMRGGRAYVIGPRPVEVTSRQPPRPPASIVVIGGGGAASAAAETLRAEGYLGPLALISDDRESPYDRPNLSKSYLAGTAPDEWLALRPARHYERLDVELLLGRRVEAIDPIGRSLSLDGGETRRYGALLLATGAWPRQLPASVEGAGQPHVRTLRTWADARELIARAERARRAVIIGASFIGLEVAAALRDRDVEVEVVGPEPRPLEHVFGARLASLVRAVHEAHGVRFHMGRTVRAIGPEAVTLDDGTTLAARLVVVGIGVAPDTRLAEAAGLRCENGVLVDDRLRTSAPGIWAAGDVARWPDARTDRRLRVEHWVVAQRQGQTAARNMLGRDVPFDAVPFFWTDQYDLSLAYVGHAERWDEEAVAGSIEDRDAVIAYREGGRTVAVATVGRDLASLEAELALERGDQSALDALVGA